MSYNITSVGHLQRYRLPTGYAEAASYLHRRRETIHLLTIYAQHFPDDFPQEWRSNQERLLPAPGDTYSVSELSCIKLIDAHLFPFALDHLLACAEEGERLSTIPLWSYGIDHWYQPLTDFPAGWQMLLLLFLDIEEVEGIPVDACVLDARQRMEKSVRRLSMPRLEALCQTAEPPLASLPVALRMIDHATDNAFLDPTDEMPCEDMFWEVADIELLANHWKEAQTMIHQTDELTEWLEACPTRLRKVVELWNQALS
jgi:hypothetical protein